MAPMNIGPSAGMSNFQMPKPAGGVMGPGASAQPSGFNRIFRPSPLPGGMRPTAGPRAFNPGGQNRFPSPGAGGLQPMNAMSGR